MDQSLARVPHPVDLVRTRERLSQSGDCQKLKTRLSTSSLKRLGKTSTAQINCDADLDENEPCGVGQTRLLTRGMKGANVLGREAVVETVQQNSEQR